MYMSDADATLMPFEAPLLPEDMIEQQEPAAGKCGIGGIGG